MDSCEKTTPRLRGTTPEIQQVAQIMRDGMTPAEQALWQALKGKQLAGLKYRAQHHDQQQGRDAVRTAQINAYGYRVIRFRNEEVLTDLPAVLGKIVQAATTSGPPIIGG